MTVIRVDRRGIAEQVRLPLIGVAADEAIEIVETHSSRPLIEWPRLARLEIRGVVVLAKPGCPIAIVLQYLANRCLVPSHEAVIARKARRLLGDDPEAHRVMIATSDDRRPGRRAKCCRVEVGIAQTVGSDLIQGRRRDDTAERAGNAK